MSVWPGVGGGGEAVVNLPAHDAQKQLALWRVHGKLSEIGVENNLT